MRASYVVSPSLEGILSHESLSYEGVRKPVEILRALDGPGGSAGDRKRQPHERQLLEQYFYDLYGVFMKRLSAFVLDAAAPDADAVRLQALLQEMVKVKKLIAR